ncbi:hypothetical protein ACSSAF_13640 (plasmid) [Staphylococcus succinus]|uniref:hypothetical protein n=1 Tax=Staphylococcus succinus TaxID=61015 RepID=UPI003F5C2E8D
MSIILLLLGVISISLLIFGFLKSNNFIKSIGFIILFLIVFIVVYFLFLTPPENIKKGSLLIVSKSNSV